MNKANLDASHSTEYQSSPEGQPSAECTSSKCDSITMKPDCNKSLRARIGKIVVIFSIVLVSFYTTMLATIYEWGLTDATHGVVWQEAEMFKSAYQLDKTTPLPHTQTLQGYIGEQNLPDSIIGLFPPERWEAWPHHEEGLLYRFRKNEGSESHYHLLISQLPDQAERLFIFYEITVTDEIASKIWRKFKILAIVGGLLVITMLVIFRATIHRSITPIGSLYNWINQLDQSSSPPKLPDDIRPDEIGELAYSLYDALERIHSHNERERQFLRNASHELRTPIAIIRNAMDVLEHKRKVGNDDIDAVLRRIRRAGDTMKSVTEAILWLAIENYTPPVKKQVNIKDMIISIIEENKNLNSGLPISLNVNLDAITDQEIEGTLLYIALDNVIRNAFQHCCDGEISISARDSHSVEIINTNHNYSYANPKQQDVAEALTSGSFGLGLTLVQKISEKQGWTFSFIIDEHQAKASLDF